MRISYDQIEQDAKQAIADGLRGLHDLSAVTSHISKNDEKLLRTFELDIRVGGAILELLHKIQRLSVQPGAIEVPAPQAQSVLPEASPVQQALHKMQLEDYEVYHEERRRKDY